VQVGFVYNLVAQNTEVGYFNFDDVTIVEQAGFAPEESDATGSAGHNDIARVQLGKAGDVVDQGRNVEVQISDRGMLADFTVHASFESEFINITDDIGGNQVRAETTGVQEVLSRDPLAGGLLPVTDGEDVVVRGPCDVVESVVFRHVPGFFSDVQGHFALVVEFFGGCWFYSRRLVTHVGIYEASKHCWRLLSGVTGFFLVGAVVDANANNFVFL